MLDRKSTGFMRRHNGLLKTAFILDGGLHSDMQYRLEPDDLLNDVDLRPDLLVEPRMVADETFTPRISVDVTFYTPFTVANLFYTTTTSHALFENMYEYKVDKCADSLCQLSDCVDFYPFVATTAGVLSPGGNSLIVLRAQKLPSSCLDSKTIQILLTTQITSAMYECGLANNSRRQDAQSPQLWLPRVGD